jgi:hypothetical protein
MAAGAVTAVREADEDADSGGGAPLTAIVSVVGLAVAPLASVIVRLALKLPAAV